MTPSPAPPSPGPVLICVGTTPEIIKMAPVHAELRRRGLRVAWVHSGQRREMAESLYAFWDIQPAYELALERRNTGLAHLHARLLEGLTAIYEQARPAAVLVHGDTTGTLASAQAAFYMDIPVGHVDAGLRSLQAREPFPEEKNREITARLAHWHFAPTHGAAMNLDREGIAPGAVHMVGSTAVDAARAGVARLDALLVRGALVLPPRLNRLVPHLARCRLITVTAHRRENWGPGIRDIARAVRRLLEQHEDLAVAWPVHGNPAVSDIVQAELGPLVEPLEGRLCLCAPLDYPALLWCLQHSAMVLTDSGGIQEEGAALSCPVLVLRNTTERPELIDAGAGLVVGTDEDQVVAAVARLLQGRTALARMRTAFNPFGDGRTAQRIADVLEHALAD